MMVQSAEAGSMKNLLMIVSFVVMLGGCQTAPQHGMPVLDNSTFMSLWSTYQHCSSSTNLEQLRVDLRTLNQASQLRTSHADFTIPLPDALLQLVSAQPTRTAADPKAMLAACAIHTAEVALERGKKEVAAELLNDVLQSHQKSEYAYYVQQAKATLERMNTGAQSLRKAEVTSPQEPKALPVASTKSVLQFSFPDLMGNLQHE
jgi:hypothetical protein